MPKVDRNQGVGLGSALMLAGVVVGFIVTMFMHHPSAARFIGSGIFTAGLTVILIGTTDADVRNKESFIGNFFVFGAFASVPLYATLSGFSVPFWTRFLIAASVLVLSIVLFAVDQVRQSRARARARIARRG